MLHSNLSKPFEKEFDTDIGTKELVRLKLLVKDGFKKRVGLHRSTGMKIDDKGHFQTPIDFSGVFIVEGERLNEVLRKMEPPTHDKWDFKLYKENQRYAEKLIKGFNKWMNTCARSLLNNTNENKIQIEGIEELLPDLSDEQAKTIKVEKDSIKDRTVEIRKKKNKRKPPKRRAKIDTDGVPGEKTHGKGKGEADRKPGNSKGDGKKTATVSKVNVYCTKPDEQIYSVFFSTQNEGEVEFKVKSIGENGNASSVDILEAKINKVHIPVSENIIGPFRMEKVKNATLEMKLNTANRLALEVIQL